MKKTKSLLLSTPYLVWMVVFTLIPLGVVAYYALTDPATGAFSLGNVKSLGMYLPVLWKSIGYSLVSAFICLLLGYPVAYYIAHRSPTAQKFLYMLVMLPMCMSFLLRTLAWVGLLQDTGIINTLLSKLGLPRLTLIRTPGAVVLGMVYNYLPYMILPLYGVIVKIDPRLIEAAEDLGCTPVQVFHKVVFPLSLPGIISGCVLVFTMSMTSYVTPKLLGGSKFRMMATMVVQEINVNFDWGAASAISYILLAVILLVQVVVVLCTSGYMKRMGGGK